VRAGLDPEEPVLHKHLVGFEKERLDRWKKRAAEDHDQLRQEMRDVKRLLQAQKETSEAQTKRMDQLGVQLVDARKGTAEVKAENDKLKKELADQKAENERLKKMLGDHKQSYTVSHNINATRLTNIEAKLGIQRGAPDA
jgi:chromosome segregation ATPase